MPPSVTEATKKSEKDGGSSDTEKIGSGLRLRGSQPLGQVGYS